MRVIGIDPGTKSFDVFGLEDDQIIIDTSIPTSRVMDSPDNLMEVIQSQEPFDYLAAPSGFGLPFKRIQELTEHDIFEMVIRKSTSKSTIGLQNVITAIKQKDWNAYTIPGVKHLPTVPAYRKVNKIDLGTADKVCSAVVGVRDIMESYSISSTETNFILIELGSGFSAVLGIKQGQIIDGIGGSNLMGFQACGAIDGELAYLMDKISKKDIYQGGLTSIIGYPEMRPSEVSLLTKTDAQTQKAVKAYIENILKAVYAIKSDFQPQIELQNILISGSVSRVPLFQELLIANLTSIAPTRLIKSYAQIAKEAAQGAAFIANGMLEGKFQDIIETMQLKNASGSILDEIYLNLNENYKM
jgi:predicted butyrate kinase (DUF1464 family)